MIIRQNLQILLHTCLSCKKKHHISALCGYCEITTGFYEERAILLGKQGRHEEALAIYVQVLHDNRMAEE